jgi:peptidoglycan hydrolase-like protein with peptidoglycan-binding domain
MAAATTNVSRGDSAGAAMMWLAITITVLLVAAGAVAATGTPGVRQHTAGADPPPAIPPLRVTGTGPAAGTEDVASNATLTVTLSAPLAVLSPLPSLTPPVAGSWLQSSPTQLWFDAAEPLLPGTSETLTVPGGTGGILGAQGQHLATATSVHFTVAQGSTLRLQQLLAELGYLPLAFVPSSSYTAPADEADPQPGTFVWRWPGEPASLTSLWSQGNDNVITTGAVMRFETENGLPTDGIAGPRVWSALLSAAADGRDDPDPYDYVYVSTNLPETVTVYSNGSSIYQTLANTGVPAMPTQAGTFPVYLRFVTTTMIGTNPTGSHYVDPGIPWVSYFNGGDALHGYIRGYYGFPQSDGCVEMPPANAEVVWPLTPIGTLVTVE